jgi:hypothetical protein
MLVSLSTFTTFHTALSLIAILAGFFVAANMLAGRAGPAWTWLFLATAVLTSATGYGFPFNGVLPSHIVGGVALVVLAVTLLARFVFGLAGVWRAVYAAGVIASLYFLVFVLIAQGFLKVPFLNALAPTGSEPAFAVAQAICLAVFAYVGWLAVKAFRRSGLPE